MTITRIPSLLQGVDLDPDAVEALADEETFVAFKRMLSVYGNASIILAKSGVPDEDINEWDDAFVYKFVDGLTRLGVVITKKES